ncbi:MAG: TolC family protein [Bacteroidales bacterium]|nr:TolC family protein [Candidatus Colimorpha pelethequi]
MNVKRFFLWLLMSVLLIPVGAQQVLTLEDCCNMALKDNNAIKISQENAAASEALRKMALTEFFPKFSANGTYMWNEKNVSLLSDEQQDKINSMGTTLQGTMQNLSYGNPSSSILDGVISTLLDQMLSSIDVATPLNAVGHEITDAFNLNTQQVAAGAVSVTQPIYLGGKLRALYKTAKLASDVSNIKYEKEKEDLLISVEEAYWRVLSVRHKQQLAEQYVKLLEQLDSDVNAMVEVELATRSDQLKVSVKLNEARMSLAKANSGLSLSRMLLFQLCGLDLNGDYIVAEDSTLTNYAPEDSLDMAAVWSARPELRMLEAAAGIADAGVKAARSTLLPNVLATGSYLTTKPNFFNGYANDFGGMFTAGVVVNIPLCHAGSFYALKAAKHKRNVAELQLDEARGKIELQANKLNYELGVANTKLQQAQSALNVAEENLRLADESFKAGMISSSDLMAAQTAWLSAESELIDAEIEMRMTYRHLQQALGRSE